MRNRRSASTKACTCGASKRSSKTTENRPAACVQMALPVLVPGRPGQRRMQHLRDLGPRAPPAPARARLRPAPRSAAAATAASAAPARRRCAPTPQPMRMWVDLQRRCSASSRVVTEPISTSPPPDGVLGQRLHRRCPRPGRRRARTDRRRRPRPRCCPAPSVTPRAARRAHEAGRSGNSIVTEPGRLEPHAAASPAPISAGQRLPDPSGRRARWRDAPARPVPGARVRGPGRRRSRAAAPRRPASAAPGRPARWPPGRWAPAASAARLRASRCALRA